MAKRSREDFEPLSSSLAPEVTGDSEPSHISVTQSDPIVPPSSSSSTSTKIIHLDTSGEASSSPFEMRCSLPPHRQTLAFASYEDYEVHYNKTHVNRCLECRKNFPTEHFLNLHIEENHDSLVSVKKDRGEKTVGILLLSLHLATDKGIIEYDFHVVNTGIDRRSSMLRLGGHRRRSSAAQHMSDIEERAQRRNSKKETVDANEKSEANKGEELPTETINEDTIEAPAQEDEDMDTLSSAMSALNFVPSSVRFGRGKGRGRGGFSRN
ncbi:hypothetical protein B7494_g1244 [Chlorociboria aeruginascens]|nr:hypothetical protein B7494_g1244 [Chlorociboria aeruginascens]